MRAADPFSLSHVSVKKIADKPLSRISSFTVSVLSFDMDLMFRRAICKSGSVEWLSEPIARTGCAFIVVGA